jgi:hypothetical protein
MFVVGVLMVAWSVGTFDENMLFPMHAALIPCGGATLLIFSGADSRLTSALSHPVMVFIGLISYSLYLVHWPLAVAWFYLVGKPGFLAVIGICGLSILLAWLNWHYVEKPFRRPHFWREHRSTFALVPLAVLLLIGAGWHMHHTGGWSFRVPTPYAAIDLGGNSAAYHRLYYGGEGYPYVGGVETEAPADLVLMGDSHGRQYAEGLYTELAKPLGLAMHISAGASCLYLPGFTRTTTGVNWNRYAVDSLRSALDIVRSSGRPPVVVVSHAWIWQLHIAALMDTNGVICRKNLTIDDVIKGLMSLKSEIGQATLVVIGNVPSTNEIDLYDAFTRPWLVQKYFTPAQSLLTSIPNEESMAFNNRLRQAARDSEAFIFLDPYDALCGPDGCRNIDENRRLVYSDTTHLSKVGSRLVIRRFLPELKAAFAARSAKQLQDRNSP